MAEKALISKLTWRTLDSQRALFPGMATFEAPDDIKTMLRATQRKSEDKIFVASFGIIADNEKDLRSFGKLCKKRQANICSAEGQKEWRWYNSVNLLADWWREARRNGAAKAGGEATAKKAEEEFWEGFAKIKNRWHLVAKGTNASKPLLKEAQTSRNTAKSYLGYTREEWQRLPETQRNRILERAYAPA